MNSIFKVHLKTDPDPHHRQHHRGLFVFRDYGTSWDEPLFYSYGDALGYAYSPHEWFSGQFDLYNSYGASGDDHKNRGPAYLFLAREFVYGLKALGSDSTSAWHLVNFLFFQLGIYFLYRISTRWMKPSAAFATAILFSTQLYRTALHQSQRPAIPDVLFTFMLRLRDGGQTHYSISQKQKTLASSSLPLCSGSQRPFVCWVHESCSFHLL
jgi:hypothetical protein